jgi:uncharacterized protein with ParB-like and HNH nuclease domain
MGKVNIHGAEFPILKVFSNEFIFTIPNFQRPYAWTTEQAGELLEDLLAFMGDNDEQVEMLTPYFLGSIVLIKEDKPDAKVVDGQQRLTTLTILLSVLRSLVPQEHIEGLTSLLYQKGILIAGIANSYRLTLRERDNPFFQKYIQHRGGIAELKELDGKLPESQKNIRDNALFFLKRLENLPARQRVRLAEFIITRCFLIVVSTPDLDSAYRIFSVLNDRGLDLSHTDILKAEIIGKIPTQQQDAYNAKWEEIEASLGREMFQSLFTYIRTIHRKVKPQDTILKEFREYVRPIEHPQQFIDKSLEPYADAFYTIKNTAYQSIKSAEKVNNLFGWLNRIDNSDWIPPAILYFSRNHNNTEAMKRFFTDLERLAASLMFIRANVNKRIERYSRLLTAIENDHDLYALNSPLQLTSEEQRDVVTYLNTNLYEYGFCKYVLLRLDESLSDVGASYNYSSISVEHVLPQNPLTNSEWIQWFPDQEERESYVHCLGNLVLLSHKKNSQAQNYDFAKKKQIYFLTANNISPFVLTTQVIQQSSWTPQVIEHRQQTLIGTLKNIWRL